MYNDIITIIIVLSIITIIIITIIIIIIIILHTFTIYIVNLSAGPVLRCNLEAVNRHSSNCHVLGLSWLVLGEFGAIPTLALLHDGLCTFDLSWISTVPRTDGTQNSLSVSVPRGKGDIPKKIDKFTI